MTTESDFEQFCSRAQPRLVGTLVLYCGDRDVAEELAQEALARACLRWPRVHRMAAPDAWIYRVAINLANSYFRRRALERRIQLRRSRDITAARHVDHDGLLALRDAVAKLPQRPRAALVLRYYAELSVSEVANLTGWPEGTVKTLTRRAIAILRQNLGTVEVEEVQSA